MKGFFANSELKYYSNYTSFAYEAGSDDNEVITEFKVRKWSDTEWHEPDVDYLFGGDDDEKHTKI